MTSRTKWIGLGALISLIAGVTVATLQWRTPRPVRTDVPNSAVTEADSSGDALIDQALGTADADEKTRWVEEIPGIDLSGLDSNRREVFLRHANSQFCDCDCGYTLAACRVYDSSCEESEPRVIALRDSVGRGEIVGAEGLRARPASSRRVPGG